ncbi:hypothetical protein [Streptomyces zagrosensis]|uniref:Lipoprotein n=1 Tax=Streptomyces zagrosensis TaxID=1042984 RepID=A0A7W9UXS9_9ACTN|nr:hypothetical protein [Streptomyces zagrosensis]MBB5935190.1 hypothetical protein [Streptomyces zagrosensis]
MTERPLRRWARARAALVTFAMVTALAFGGVWLMRTGKAADAMQEAPRTAAVQASKPDRVKAAGLPGVRDCGQDKPVLKPEIITLMCPDGGVVASEVRWERYASDGANGTGVVQVSGATGAAPVSYRAEFSLYGPKNVDGELAFTGLSVTYFGPTPFGDSSETYSIA